MTMLSFRVEETEAGSAPAWADRLGQPLAAAADRGPAEEWTDWAHAAG